MRLANGMPAQDLVNQPLTKAALDGLNEQATFDTAVDAVCELIRYTVSGQGLGDLLAHMPLVQVRGDYPLEAAWGTVALMLTCRYRIGHVAGCSFPTWDDKLR